MSRSRITLLCLAVYAGYAGAAVADERHHGRIRVSGRLVERAGGQVKQVPFLEVDHVAYQLLFDDDSKLTRKVADPSAVWKPHVGRSVTVDGELEIRLGESSKTDQGIRVRTNHYIHVQSMESSRDVMERRRTAAVSVNEANRMAVLHLINRKGDGTAFLIDSRGFAITNRHVVSSEAGGVVTQPDGTVSPYRVIGRGVGARNDLALILVMLEKETRSVLLGDSSDLMVGEEIIAIANPHGVHTLTRGVVTRIDLDDQGVERQIWTDADIFGGSSGGPLFNDRGEVVAVIKGGIGDDLNYGLSVGRLRRCLDEILALEQRYQFTFGADIDSTSPVAKVTSVTAGSPAADAGLVAGDVIVRMGRRAVRDGIDFRLSLVFRKPGESLKLNVLRGDEQVPLEVVLGPHNAPEPVDVDEDQLAPGLSYAIYEGHFQNLPDFSSRKVAHRGILNTPGIPDPWADKDEFAVQLSGYLRVHHDDLYTFGVWSDDGSRLKIADQWVLNNDGVHGPEHASGRIRLKPGLYPIQIDYFDENGDQELKIEFRRTNSESTELPAEDLFHLE